MAKELCVVEWVDEPHRGQRNQVEARYIQCPGEDLCPGMQVALKYSKRGRSYNGKYLGTKEEVISNYQAATDVQDAVLNKIDEQLSDLEAKGTDVKNVDLSAGIGSSSANGKPAPQKRARKKTGSKGKEREVCIST